MILAYRALAEHGPRLRERPEGFWTFLEARGASWKQPSLELLGEFTAWLRQPADNVVVLATGRPHRSTKTVNRMLTAVTGELQVP